MKTIAKLSVQEYERIVATGVFDGKNRRRVELIRGELREMSPIGPAHNQIVAWLNKWSVRNIPSDDVGVRIQSSLALADADCEPEPDVVWVSSDEFLAENPTAADVLLLIEVADSSLEYDRGEKAELYAEAGIADYWVVNLIDHTVEVHRGPANGRYADVRSFGIADTIQPLAAPEARLEIASLFVTRP
jgi:Uma2 family endonuclease